MNQMIKHRVPILFGLGLLACNFHLLLGVSPFFLVYQNDLVLHGEWWRIFTHQLVHVSWYHLFIDVLAVVILWREVVIVTTKWRRLAVVVLCSAGSLLAAACLSKVAQVSGYCGLSGLAHGLMSFVGLAWLFKGVPARSDITGLLKIFSGALFLLISAGKPVVEVVSGSFLFMQFHYGEIGIPVVHAHFGGAVGGFVAFAILTIYTGTAESSVCDDGSTFL